MINWDEFEHIHVIQKLKKIIQQWFDIDTLFTDDRGQIRGFNKDKHTYHNPAVKIILTKDRGIDSLAQFVQNIIEDLRKTNNRYVVREWPEAGFDAAVFPIIIDGEFMGSVVALGFFKDNITDAKLNKLKTQLAQFDAHASEIESACSKMHSFKEDERNYFVELVDLVGQEVVTLHTEIQSRETRIHELNKELGVRYKYDNMIGKSKPMQEIYALLDKIKNSESTVLINGENGTGKELIARAIHYNSPRKDKAFVSQNCSAFNENLLDSELFGHVKGSFTGAIKDKKGLFEIADKGTFFLDEIGDTSPSMQVKLLRVIQEGTFIPVGATETRRVDVRILAATNRDLKDMVEKGLFREDLYYRINVINIKVPPLRDRKEDIPLLTDFFLEKVANEKNQKKKIITKRALEKLYDFAWPGNIRELQNEIERLVVLAGEEMKLTADMLSPRLLEYGEKNKVQGARVHGKLKDALEELEREMIREGLRRTGWNKSKLAKELGISRAGLIMKVEKYGLDKRKLLK
ncbi:MAG: sigma 54-interacting transcriptional regulator [Oligoflexia bacterium]|nr:sigma 54-interacting transcriptional regulator [Oligoflexia bacterium]